MLNASAERKRRTYHWSDEAHKLVRGSFQNSTHKNPELLHAKLSEMTEYESQVVWRFLHGYGFELPGRTRRTEQQDSEMLAYLMDFGYRATEQKFKCSRAVLSRLARKNERVVGRSANGYSLHQLTSMLTLRYELLLDYIRKGFLGATAIELPGKRTSYFVSDEQLRDFCFSHKDKLRILPRRFPEKRVRFLEQFLFEPTPADLGLLKTREAKKEAQAYSDHLLLSEPSPYVSGSARAADA